MLYSQMFGVIDRAGLSPEKAGKLLGVSGMTLRRWRALPGKTEVPALYARSFENAVAQLVADGVLSSADREVGKILSDGGLHHFELTAKSLGFSGDLLARPEAEARETVLLGLSQLGADSSKTREVDRSARRVSAFGKLDAEWRRRVGGLWGVVRSTRIGATDKLIAYGALFYLITLFDLVPDALPGFGLIDDFAILGMALLYYRKRFPEALN